MLAYSVDGADGLGNILDDIGSAIKTGASAVVGAVKSAASTACSIVQSPAIQQAAQVGALVAGGSTAANITSGTSKANSICAAVSPPAPSPAAAPSGGGGLFPSIKLPFSPLKPAGAGRYKAGSVARFNVTRGTWSIYSPLAGAGLGMALGVVSDGRCIGGDCLGEVNPPVPAGFVKVGEELAPPADVAQGGQETDKRPLYKNPYFWLAIGGAVVVGGGGFYLMRRRRRTSTS